MSFKDFKKKSVNSINDLVKRLEEQESKKNYKDDRFWRAATDKVGNGWAIIRFLDAKKVGDEITPFVEIKSHSFEGPGGWYIENSLDTLGMKDPAKEINDILWKGSEDDKNLARSRNQKKQYISNILVIKDEANPENEGKVFLFKYGIKIFDKIKEKSKPEFGDTDPIDIFNFDEGANFRLKIRKVGGYTNYDKSEFEAQSKLFDGDMEKQEKVWNQLYPLQEFISPSNFKSYDELKERLDIVLAGNIRGTPSSNKKTVEDESEEEFKPSKMNMKEKAKVEDIDEEEVDALSFFKNKSSK
jgi:hypothetical protein